MKVQINQFFFSISNTCMLASGLDCEITVWFRKLVVYLQFPYIEFYQLLKFQIGSQTIYSIYSCS